jgi:hypothetical protein
MYILFLQHHVQDCADFVLTDEETEWSAITDKTDRSEFSRKVFAQRPEKRTQKTCSGDDPQDVCHANRRARRSNELGVCKEI